MTQFKWNEPSEKEIEEACLTFLNYQVGCFAFKVVTKAFFDPELGRYRNLPKGVVKGTPDILCCYSFKGIGVFIGFEVKDPKGRQSPDQKSFETQLDYKADGLYFIVRSIKDVELALQKVREMLESHIKDLYRLYSL